jgi:alkaline phosphatase
MSQHQFGRREFIRISAATGLTAAISGATNGHAGAGAAGRGKPRNIILMIADGMSIGTLTLADMQIRASRQKPSHWVTLWSRPGVVRSMCATFAANALVTDSAAAGSAMSIGERVNNGAICITSDGREPVPILVRAQKRGLATGLVTTTRITHATPASFIANAPSRNQEAIIAEQLLARGVTVALGGGSRHFRPAQLELQPDLQTVRTREELLAATSAPGKRLLGLFADSHMSFEIDRPAQQPSLADMASAALDILARHPGGFIVQIEGGRVDHAAHNNDVAALIQDQIAFDDALGVAIDFVSERDDTLLIVTTDHANGNPGLTVYGPEGISRFERIASARRSFEWIASELRKIETPGAQAEELPRLVSEACGITLTAGEQESLLRVRAGESAHPSSLSNSLLPVLGAVLTNHFGVGFASPNHTSDFVEVTATGPGSEALSPVIDNTDLHTLMSEALDLPSPAAL